MYKHYFLFAFYTFVVLQGNVLIAQNQAKIDSLKQLVYQYSSAKKQDSLTVIFWNDYAGLNSIANLDTTIYYAQKALSLSRRLKYEDGIVESLRNMGTGYAIKGEVSEAAKYLEEALKIAEKKQNPKQLSKIYNNFGNLYITKDAEVALKYYLLALEIRKKQGDKRQLSVAYLNIGSAYTRLKKYDEALTNYQESLTLKEQLKDKRGVALLYGNIGVIHKDKKEYEIAKKYTSQAITLHQEIKDDSGLFYAFNLMGDILEIEKKYAEAINYQLEALKVSEKIHSKKQIVSATGRLQKLFATTKNFEKAYQYSVLFKTYSDSLLNESNIKQTTQLEDKIAYEKKEIALKATQEKELAEQKYYNYLILSVLCSFIFLLLSFLRGRYLQRKSNQLLAKQNIDIQQKTEELQKANITLREQSLALSEINHTKDKIFAIIGHDLRSPINSLKGILTLLNKHYISQEEFAMLSARLQNSVETTYFTLNNLLQWANSQMEGIVVKSTTFSISQVIDENFDLFVEIAKGKNLVLQNDVHKEISVFADQDQISLVLRNLISNAIKFTTEGTGIVVRGKIKKDFYELCVHDSGVGMSMEVQKDLFTSHLTTSGTKGEKGTGLGLSLCKDFVEKNGGRIWVESELGMGSCFFFTLPLKNVENN